MQSSGSQPAESWSVAEGDARESAEMQVGSVGSHGAGAEDSSLDDCNRDEAIDVISAVGVTAAPSVDSVVKREVVKRDYEVHEFYPDVQVFRGEWDDEGVFFYQAYNDDIADWALQHQQFGGPKFKPVRMTWIKPSFAWVLYRSGYGYKHSQNRILKVKIPHAAVADLLSRCQCKEGGGGSNGRVQWDPGRDLESWDGKVPRELLRERAIQIGLKDSNSELYVRSVVCIQDVTELGRRLKEAHAAKSKDAMREIWADLPRERPYLPCCEEAVLKRLQMLPGERAPKPVRKGKHR